MGQIFMTVPTRVLFRVSKIILKDNLAANLLLVETRPSRRSSREFELFHFLGSAGADSKLVR